MEYADQIVDLVDHNILLDKLKYYGIRGNAFTLIHSYLNDRKQVVAIQNQNGKIILSDWKEISCGAPQGSILGSLLFSLYIIDLPGNIHPLKTVLYADDTNVIVSHSDINALKVKVDNVRPFSRH